MKKCNSNSVYNEKGFTLIEILIAIFLLAFVSLGIVSITSDSVSTKERTVARDRDNLQIETALSRFEWDFSQIYSPLYYSQRMQLSGDPNGQTAPTPEQQQTYEAVMSRYELVENFAYPNQDGVPVPRFDAPEKNIFEFFTSSNRRKMQNQKQSNYSWVRYSLVDTPKDDTADEIPLDSAGKEIQITKTGKSFARYVQAVNPWGDKRIDTENVKAQILLDNVEALEFQYWDTNRLKWETSITSVNQGEFLLRGVKLIITWYDKAGVKRTVTKIFRPLWPSVVPQDPVQQTTTTGTATAGTAAAGTNTGGDQSTGSTAGTASAGTNGSSQTEEEN